MNYSKLNYVKLYKLKLKKYSFNKFLIFNNLIKKFKTRDVTIHKKYCIQYQSRKEIG